MKTSKVGGIQVDCMLDLLQLCLPIQMPASYESLRLTGPSTGVPRIEGTTVEEDAEGEEGEAGAVVPQVTAQAHPMPWVSIKAPLLSKKVIHIPMDTLAYEVRCI